MLVCCAGELQERPLSPSLGASQAIHCVHDALPCVDRSKEEIPATPIIPGKHKAPLLVYIIYRPEMKT
jgi:hypothetical protein